MDLIFVHQICTVKTRSDPQLLDNLAFHEKVSSGKESCETGGEKLEDEKVSGSACEGLEVSTKELPAGSS